MAKRRSYVNVGGSGYPRANWWKQTLGTDYYNRQGGGALPDTLLWDDGQDLLWDDGAPNDNILWDLTVWILASGIWNDVGVWSDNMAWID